VDGVIVLGPSADDTKLISGTSFGEPDIWESLTCLLFCDARSVSRAGADFRESKGEIVKGGFWIDAEEPDMLDEVAIVGACIDDGYDPEKLPEAGDV
jgi:hypothetical protein